MRKILFSMAINLLLFVLLPAFVLAKPTTNKLDIHPSEQPAVFHDIFVQKGSQWHHTGILRYNRYCVYGHHNYGHTYFYNLVSTWYWDTKGYVPNDQASDHYKNHNYFTPLIYPFPLDNYLNEGAYPQISLGGAPMDITGCGLNQCYDTNYSSPLNLNDSEAAAP